MKGEQQTCERQLSRSVMTCCPVNYPRYRGKRRTSGQEIPIWKDQVRKSKNRYFPPRVKLYKRYSVINASFVKAVFAVEGNININVKEQICCRYPFRILQLFSCLIITASLNVFTSGLSSPLCFILLRVGKSVKTQLSKNVIYQFDGDDMFRPNLAIFRSICYLQLTVKKYVFSSSLLIVDSILT